MTIDERERFNKLADISMDEKVTQLERMNALLLMRMMVDEIIIKREEKSNGK